MLYTLGQAAKVAGVSKTTISNAVKSGRLSAGRGDKNQYQIDAAELARVYPVDGKVDGKSERDKTPESTAVLQAQVDGLRERLDDMKAMLEREREVSEREREQADKWRETAEHNQRLLADQRPRRGWFGLGRAS